MYPLIHRDRCLNQFPHLLFASSRVTESIIAVLYPALNNRVPKSASSVTLNGSQPCNRIKSAVRKWLDVPPSGMLVLTDCKPVSVTSNHNEYSAVKNRVKRF